MASARSKEPAAQRGALETSNQLLQEVQFWRDLVTTIDSAKQSRESIERMKQALALAEYRLAALARNNRD